MLPRSTESPFGGSDSTHALHPPHGVNATRAPRLEVRQARSTQSRRAAPRFRTLHALTVAGAIALAGCVAGEAENAPVEPPAPEITSAEVLVRNLRDWADFTGRLEAVSSVEVRARVGGYVESVHFEEGGRVAEDDLLFQIDPRPFKAEADRLRAERQRARAELELARSYRARAERLFAQNATSREELESLEADAAVAEAALAAVEAALESAELELSFTRVTAPIAGRVSRAIVTAGNLVDSSNLLTTLVSDDPIYVYFDADEHTYLEQVSKASTESNSGRAERGARPSKTSGAHGSSGAHGAAVYVGLINEQGYPHRARLDFVDNQVDADHGTIRARAVLDNSDGRFTPGLFARLRVVGSEAYRAALVDDRAIGTDLGRKFVLTVDEQDVAQYRAVETGPLVDDLRVVTSGLASGDVVIVNGLQRVRPGMTVAPTQVAMQRDAAQLERFATTQDATEDGAATAGSGSADAEDAVASTAGSAAPAEGAVASTEGAVASADGGGSGRRARWRP